MSGARFLLPLLAALLVLTGDSFAQNSVADVLGAPGLNLGDPAERAQAVASIDAMVTQRTQAARARAVQLGLPVRVVQAGGRVMEIADFVGNEPVYFTTHNVNAAISTGANLLRIAPYTLTGTGITVGLWDGGSARATHVEFATGSRVVAKDGAASIDHATHVGGTIAAAGVNASAKGMAPSAIVDSYDWNSDITEMTSRAATAPNQAGMIYLSNHSYGYVGGWNYVGGGGSPARTWEWYGDGTTTTGYEYDFGRYNTYSRQSDSLAFSAPYYLVFRSAGNDRGDNPANGSTVALSPGSTTVVTYSSTTHPAGDALYRGGFETISYDALGKNVMTVGSVSDAVSGGLRSPSVATVSYFSSWGPTDDGRIKPDIVANGEALFSSLNGGDTSYGTYSGTSMATPNATGTAALLIQQYAQLFPGGAMRSSTLKGLLIHTADDMGNPGPDYKHGWGLVNGVAAVDLICDHAANPMKVRMNEGVITSTTTTVNHEFVWDGVSPIRATLCWTDPAGTATTTNDLRTPRLINNLNLKITGPAGSEHLPFVMPFVGTWTQAAMDLPATTGVNNVDNVEQVYVASPPASGVYRCVVTFSGTLANNLQNYSLLISGSANQTPPPPPLTITSITPTSALPGAVTMDITGVSFKTGAVVKLIRSGQTDITATSTTFNSSTSLRSQFNLAGAAAGAWSVKVTNPDNETFTLANAFTVVGALWSESFDGTVASWSSQATTGANAWALTTAQSQSPTTSYFAPGPSSKTTCNLTSPSISIPGNAINMQFTFWHSYNLQSTRDAGKLEFSIDSGSWFDVVASGSGAAFASNGYNATVNNTGNPSDRNEFAGQQAWSGNSSGFIQTIINLTETTKYAGHSLRARWRIATNASTSSVGWYVDSVALTGGANQTNQAPSITTAADTASTETVTDPDSTVFEIVRGQSVTASVAASDDGGESGIIYTWSSAQSGGVAPSFSVNGTNAAKNTTVFFEATGDYLLTATARDAQGLAASSSVNVRVLATASSISVAPASVSVTVGGTQAFTATQLDQFGQPTSPQPASFGWSTSGGGGINTSGLFTASTAGGPYVITATNAALSGTASVTVNRAPASITLSNLTRTYDGAPKPVTTTTTPGGLSTAVTYNGGTTAPAVAGSYSVVATITDPNYQGSASGTLIINPAPASIALSNLTRVYDGSPKPVAATTTPGGLPVSITYNGNTTAPSDFGSYSIVGTITDPNYQGSASGTLSITGQPLSTWQSQQFTPAQISSGAAADDADPDGDGLKNLAEYGLGTDPNHNTPTLACVRDAGGLSLTFTRPKGLPDVTYAAESSTDLVSWTPITITLVTDGPTQTMRTMDPLTTGNPGCRFIRLRFSH